MNKKRTIIIKDPRLQKIRNNLRSLILEASRSVQHKLMSKKEEFSKRIIKETDGDHGMLHDQSRMIEKQIQMIDHHLDASIIFCPICFKSNKDMTYNPIVKKWYCTECYEKLKKGYSDDGEPNRFP